MYRDDDKARDDRANVLIDEIAELERAKVAHAASERRLDDARRELAALQPAAAPVPATPAGIATHAVVFCVAACGAFGLYTLVF